MRSPSSLPPLNSSTTALSSSSSSFSSFSPSSLFPSYTQSPSQPSFPSLLLLFLTVISLLLSHVAASAIPTPSSRQDRIIWNLQKNGSLSVNLSQFEMFQGDEPPRNIDKGIEIPDEWKTTRRYGFLKTKRHQFLQIHNKKVSGNTEEIPSLNMLVFHSHNNNIVIEAAVSGTYLCMSHEYKIYMSDHLNDECYLEEKFLYFNGSSTFNYKFKKYSTARKPLYLGINCQPLLGIEADSHHKNAKFYKLLRKEEDSDELKNRWKTNSAITPSVCKKRFSEKAKKRRKIKRYRKRWCAKAFYKKSALVNMFGRCKTMFESECSKRRRGNKKGRKKNKCPCQLIADLITKPKRGKRKCVVDHIASFVERRTQGKPNRQAIKRLFSKVYEEDIYCSIIKCRRKKSHGDGSQSKNKTVILKDILGKFRHDLVINARRTSHFSSFSPSPSPTPSTTSTPYLIKLPIHRHRHRASRGKKTRGKSRSRSR